MNWKISILLMAFFISSCTNEKVVEIDANTKKYLIEVDGLKAIIGQANIKILDFRKKEFYEKEHIPNALNIWRTDIENDSFAYKGMMASKVQIESLFGNLGIETNDTVVIYDDNGLCDASRLWWLLQNYDFTNVKLLHGGISAWKKEGGKLTTEIPVTIETTFELPEKSTMQYYASKEQVQEALKSNTLILDTRTTDEFTGKRQKKGAAKGGRIPNSIHIDWAEAINYNGDKCMKELQSLESIYSKLNIEKDDPIIVYCHSGVRSAHTSYVLTQLLGYQNVKNYDGSWTEWSYFDHLPFERDSTTVIN